MSAQTAFDLSEEVAEFCHKKKSGGQRKYPIGYGFGSRLYHIFHGMHARCYNPNEERYSDYGGRGITVCPEWYRNYKAFLEWALANGYTHDLTIDREDNNLGYSPDNCRWSTYFTQANNSRKNHCLTAWGETKTIAEWARDPRCLVNRTNLHRRLSKGIPVEIALTKTRGAITKKVMKTLGLL